MKKSLMVTSVVVLLISIVGASSSIANAAWAMTEEMTVRSNSQVASEGRGVALGVTPTATATDTSTATATNTPSSPTDTPTATPTDTPSPPTKKTPKPTPPPSPTPTSLPLLPEAGSPAGSEWVGWAAPAFIAVFFLALSMATRQVRDS